MCVGTLCTAEFTMTYVVPTIFDYDSVDNSFTSFTIDVDNIPTTDLYSLVTCHSGCVSTTDFTYTSYESAVPLSNAMSDGTTITLDSSDGTVPNLVYPDFSQITDLSANNYFTF